MLKWETHRVWLTVWPAPALEKTQPSNLMLFQLDRIPHLYSKHGETKHSTYLPNNAIQQQLLIRLLCFMWPRTEKLLGPIYRDSEAVILLKKGAASKQAADSDNFLGFVQSGSTGIACVRNNVCERSCRVCFIAHPSNRQDYSRDKQEFKPFHGLHLPFDDQALLVL